jgi:hypothetical protein
MSQQLNHQVQFGKEVTRGTPVATTLELPVVEDGFRPTITNALGEVMASSTFPYITDQVPVGVTAELSITADANRDTIRDIILMCTKRTAGLLPSFTIIDDQQGVGTARYSGCVARQLTLQYSQSGTPDGSAILRATMQFDCMKVENGQGSIAALSQAVARHFIMNRGSTTVNNVAATGVLSTIIEWINNLSMGPVDAANVRTWLVEQSERTSVRHVARFAATTWRALVEAATQANTNTITIATGTANETVTLSIPAAQINSRTLGESAGEVTEEITLMPFGSGGPAISPAFGSAIGASLLGL